MHSIYSLNNCIMCHIFRTESVCADRHKLRRCSRRAQGQGAPPSQRVAGQSPATLASSPGLQVTDGVQAELTQNKKGFISKPLFLRNFGIEPALRIRLVHKRRICVFVRHPGGFHHFDCFKRNADNQDNARSTNTHG